MAAHHGFGEAAVIIRNRSRECQHLRRRARVLASITTHISNVNAVCVVITRTVDHLVDVGQVVRIAGSVDEDVITRVFPPQFAPMCPDAVQALAALTARAMNDNVRDATAALQ